MDYPDLEKALAQIQRKQGLDNPALVGTLLRDCYQIPSVRALTGKKLSEFLPAGKDSQTHYQRARIGRALNRTRIHLSQNPKDYPVARMIHRYQAYKANLDGLRGKRP